MCLQISNYKVQTYKCMFTNISIIFFQPTLAIRYKFTATPSWHAMAGWKTMLEFASITASMDSTFLSGFRKIPSLTVGLLVHGFHRLPLLDAFQQVLL